MKSQKQLNFKWTSMFILFVIISVTNVLGQKNPLLKLPSGDWSFGISVYHGTDQQEFPVAVWKVVSEIDAGVGATEIGIVNNSNKSVAAIRFKWLLFDGEKRDAILQQGSSPLLALRTVLAPEGKKILLYQPVSLLKIYRPFLKNNVLNGDFEAEILIEEVVFSDNSTWKKGDKQAKQQNKKSESDLKIIPASLAQCGKQKCKSNVSGTGNTVYYTCEPSTFNEYCSPKDNSRRCENIACGVGGGGGIEPETPIDYPGNP